MKTGPSKRKPQKAVALALLLACVFSVAASPAYARTVKQKKQAAKGYLDQADKLRDALLGTPEGDRDKRDYQKAIDAYRKVYYTAPSYAKADAAVLAVAELLDDEGRVFNDPKSFKDAIGQLVFLRREYPGSKYRVGALYTIAEIYRDDLKRLPENGWSLFGLSEALAAQEKRGAELEATRARFNKVWAKADVKITSSCLCRPRLTANCELNRTSTPLLLSAD